MENSVKDFYEHLANNYHLIFEDWEKSVRKQGEIFNNIIRTEMEGETYSILDCSCGIGTQAIGLAQHGYKVTATDLSPKSIQFAKKYAQTKGVSIHFGVADFRTLNKDVQGNFNVVLSADNALPHLLKEEDLQLSINNMYEKLLPGGLLILTIRDYDALVKEKPTSFPPRVMDEGKRMVFQTWEWSNEHPTYIVNQFIMINKKGEWVTSHSKTTYRTLFREELDEQINRSSFREKKWLEPSQSGFYQPILIARK